MANYSFDTKVKMLYETMSKAFTELDDMTASMLRSYCVTCIQVDEITARIKKEGYFIDTPKGKKENPAINTLHKLNSDKARYFTPLKRFLNKQTEGAVDVDFQAFQEG